MIGCPIYKKIDKNFSNEYHLNNVFIESTISNKFIEQNIDIFNKNKFYFPNNEMLIYLITDEDMDSEITFQYVSFTSNGLKRILNNKKYRERYIKMMPKSHKKYTKYEEFIKTPLSNHYRKSLNIDPSNVKILEENPQFINYRLLPLNEEAVHLFEKVAIENPNKLANVGWTHMCKNKNALHILNRHAERINWEILIHNKNIKGVLYLFTKYKKLDMKYLDILAPSLFYMNILSKTCEEHFGMTEEEYIFSKSYDELFNIFGRRMENDISEKGAVELFYKYQDIFWKKQGFGDFIGNIIGSVTRKDTMISLWYANKFALHYMVDLDYEKMRKNNEKFRMELIQYTNGDKKTTASNNFSFKSFLFGLIMFFLKFNNFLFH